MGNDGGQGLGHGATLTSSLRRHRPDMVAPSRRGGMRMKAFGRFVPLAVILIALVALYFSPARHLITLDSLRAHQLALQTLVREHPVEAVSLYMAAYAACCALCLPFNLIITLAGGLMFGPWVATPATV